MRPASILTVILICAIWGAGFSCMKIGLETLPPFLYVGGRFALSALCLLPWMAWRRIPLAIPARALGPMAAIVALFVFQQALVFLALSHTTAGRVGVLINTQPIITALVAHWAIAHDRLTPGKALGLVTAVFGVAVIFRESLGPGAPGALTGDLMALGAALGWGVQNIFTKAAVRHVSPTALTVWLCGIASLCFLGVSLACDPRPIPRQPIGPLFVWTAAYVILVATVIAFVAWVWLLEHNPPSRVASFCFITPVASVLFGRLMLGEPLTPHTLAGTALVGLGIVAANLRADRARDDAAPPLPPA